MHNKIITPISSTTNQWPQIIILDDHKTDFMASSSTTTTIANAHNKPSSAVAAAANQQQQDLHPLKCPRCDSSNTKFCYYNNYSLSQPRHFCKACKRYWTRGGTLRNVPVGGGCRKNKRPKRHSSAGSGGGDSLSSVSNPSSQPHNQIDLPLSSNNHLHHQNNNNNNNPLFYGGGLSSNPLELNFPFSSFRVSNSADNSAFDLNALGLGFSSGLADSNGYKNGFKPIQDASSAASPFSSSTNNNNSIFFGSSAFSTTASTMASLLASTQKFGAPGLMHYEDPQMAGMGKQQQVKAEGENRLAGWNPNPHQSQSQSQSQNLSLNPMDQMNNDLSDPSPLVWNTSGLSGWFDPSSMGSSVPSLI